MIQIYNKQTTTYEKWGSKRSPITSDTATSGGVNGLENGYVICSKNYPIPPMGTASPNFGDTNGTFGRTTRVYELSNFANSIILYKKDSTPINTTIQSTLSANSKLVSALKGEANKELNPSSSGYEIKLWLENQYDSGSMSENDFNVVTLVNDNNGNPINFQNVLPPSNPIELEALIVFNDLGNVNDGNTVIQLTVKDPKKTTKTGEYNASINFVGIKFEYGNISDTTETIDWKELKRIYYSESAINTSNSLPSHLNITSGIHVINRLNNHSSIDSNDTTTTYYYYLKLNDDFLDVTNNDMKNNFKFRISYKNASVDSFGDLKESNLIAINNPNKPTITSVIMTSYNEFTITLASFTNKEDIIGNTTNIVNTDMGVFLRNINFNVGYKYSNEATTTNIDTFTGIVGGQSSSTTATNTPVFINTTTFNSSTYTYTLPDGFYPSGSTNTNSITYYFSASVQNNIISQYSNFSDQVSIQITKPDSSIDLVLTPQTATTNYNNKIKATWTAPSNGNRGIVSAQANSGLPKLDKYTFESATIRQVNDDTTVGHSNTIITSTRSADPITYLMFTFYDTLKKTTTDSTTKDLDLKIREYNEYIKNYTEVSKTISATATKPAVVSIDSETSLSISNTSSKNTVTLNWFHPTNRGLTIENNNIRNTILTYTIDISRHSTTNKYLISNSSHTDTTYQATTTQTDNTNDKTGTTDAVNNKTLTSTNDNSLLWPNSTYNYTIRATNSLGYQSDMQTTVGEFTTGVPTIPTAFNYFNDSRLNSLRNTYDLKNSSNYSSLGVLVSAGVSSSTTYSGTAVQITNYNNLSDITSDIVTHVLNKKHLQNFSSPLSNSNVQTWSSSVPTTANQAGFKIVNAADNDEELYTRGMSTDHTTETVDSTLFEVLRTNRKDIYSETYDDRNRGYWLKESIQYKINLAAESNLTSYLYQPLRLELKSYYNENGSDTTISSNQTGETIILQNSYSTNTDENVYLDSLNSNPRIVKNGSRNMITYTPSNQINGIPNLARGGTINLEYKLSNYSEYYLLQNSKNVAEHYFSYATSSANSVISWSSKAGGTRNYDHWIISKTLSSIPVTNTAKTGITIKIRGRNTKGQTDLTIGSSHSSVINFIYDKPSSDEFGTIESSLQEVPANFDPKYGTTSAQSTYSTTAYSAKNGSINNKQLSLWDNYFYGSDGWRNATSITTANCANYGMSNTLPVFSTGNDYKWVIFKYQGQGNATSAYTYYTVIAKFSDSDFDYNNNVVNEDILIFFYNRGLQTQGNDSNNYYWLNISGKSDYGKADASTGGINTYSGTVGISTQNANSSNFESNSYSKLGTSGARILGGWLNSSSIPANTTANFYLAVGIKNTTSSGGNHVKIKKPEITLAQESVVRQILS